MADEPSDTQLALVELSRIKQEISSATSRRHEMVLDGLSKLNWDDFIIPAPYSVAILGQLVAVATSESANFPFQDVPEGGFKRIKWPKSFRASLLQLSHEGYDAFRIADKNMGEIVLHTEFNREGIKKCLEMMFEASPEDIKKVIFLITQQTQHLPIRLNNMKKQTEECAKKAQAVEAGFVSVMALIQELLEATTNEEDVRKRENDHVRQGIEAAKRQIEALKKEEEFIKANQERTKKEVETAAAVAEKVKASKPTGLDLLGMNLAETAMHTASRACIVYADNMSNPLNKVLKSGGKDGANTQGLIGGLGGINLNINAQNSPSPSTQQINPSKATEKSQPQASPQIKLDAAHTAAAAILLNLSSLQDLADETKDKIVKDTSSSARQHLEMIVENLKDSDQTQNVIDAIALCNKGIKVADEIKSIYQNVKDKKSPKELVDKALEKLGNSVVKANQLETVAKNLLGAFTSPPSPLATEALAQLPASQNLATQMVNNYRADLDSATICLNEAKNRYENHVNLQLANMKQMNQILEKMQQFEEKNANFDKIKKILVDAMLALTDLREQWGKLVEFFTNIASIIGVRMVHALGLFMKTIEAEQQDMSKKIDDGSVVAISTFTQNDLNNLALDAAKITFFVNKISSTYYTVSQEHLMPQLLSLSEIIRLKPATDAKQISEKKADLIKKCNKAINGIMSEVNKQVDEYQISFKTRFAAIEKAKQDLPKVPATPSYKAIKAAEKETKVVAAEASESVKQPVKKLKSYYVADD